MDHLVEIVGYRILDCSCELVMQTEAQARDLVGAALSLRCKWALVPVARLAPDFFRLATGLAGAVAQKFANYDIGLAVIGDIDAHLVKSAPLRDFVRETNRGSRLWFLATNADFERKLAG